MMIASVKPYGSKPRFGALSLPQKVEWVTMRTQLLQAMGTPQAMAHYSAMPPTELLSIIQLVDTQAQLIRNKQFRGTRSPATSQRLQQAEQLRTQLADILTQNLKRNPYLRPWEVFKLGDQLNTLPPSTLNGGFSPSTTLWDTFKQTAKLAQ